MSNITGYAISAVTAVVTTLVVSDALLSPIEEAANTSTTSKMVEGSAFTPSNDNNPNWCIACRISRSDDKYESKTCRPNNPTAQTSQTVEGSTFTPSNGYLSNWCIDCRIPPSVEKYESKTCGPVNPTALTRNYTR